MSHSYHDALPGYHPDQILHSGCPECEARGRDFQSAMAHMDRWTFCRAWRRAANLFATYPPDERARHVSATERPLLQNLWAVMVRFEKVWPLGHLPEDVR